MENKNNKNPVKPQGIHIEVTQNGVLTANVRFPFSIAKMWMKFGQITDFSKKKGNAEDALEHLKDVDLDAIFESLNNGELSLPCLLAEVDEHNQHVKITLE